MESKQTNTGEQKKFSMEDILPTAMVRKSKSHEVPEENVIDEISSSGNVTERNEESIGTDDTIEPENNTGTIDSLQTEPTELADATRPTGTTSTKRPNGKHRKESLEEYRQAFLQVPKLEDRKPVFVSRGVRDRLDEIARRLGGRGMSVSGFIENIALHHLELYLESIEVWKKL